jgi:peroxiredoxin
MTTTPNQTVLTTVDWSAIPAPEDDGAMAGLAGKPLPAVVLPATDGRQIDLSRQSGRVVIYGYPMTGRPGVALPDGWDSIPGARGCTPQSCAFRDHHDELAREGVAAVFGISTQDSDYQREARERLHLPFPLLSDATLAFAHAAGIPTFTAEGRTLLKRFALVADDGVVTAVFYPVFPPDQNAEQVLVWLRANPRLA